MITFRHDEAEHYWSYVYASEKVLRSPWGQTYVLKHPEFTINQEATKIYDYAYNELSREYLTDKQVRKALRENGSFTDEHEKSISFLRKEAIKLLSRYRAFSFRDMDLPAKETLSKLSGILGNIAKIESPYTALKLHTAEFNASMHRNLFLLSKLSFFMDHGEKRVWDNFKQIMKDRGTYQVTYLMGEMTTTLNGLPDIFIRALARSGISKMYFEAAQKSGRGMFKADPCDYSIDQLSLINWLSYYDAVHKNLGPVPDHLDESDEKFDEWVEQKIAEQKRQSKEHASPVAPRQQNKRPPPPSGEMTPQQKAAFNKNPKNRAHKFNLTPNNVVPIITDRTKGAKA